MIKIMAKNKKAPLSSLPHYYGWLVGRSEREFFVEHLGLMLASGLDVNSALDAIAKEVRSVFARRATAFIKEQVEEGQPLWQSLDSSHLFSAQVISLIRLGEYSGRLAENLKLIVTQQRKDQTFKSRLRSAMMYPVFVVSLTVIVGVGIAWFILPRLAQVFSSMKIKLPMMTQWLIDAGSFLAKYGSIFMPSLIIGVIIIVYFLFFFRRFKFIGQWILFNIPGVRGVIQEIQIARFGYILGGLLGSGLPVLEALDSLERSTSFVKYKKLYAHIRGQVEEGFSLKTSFESYRRSKKYFPIFVQQIVFSGEQSGRLDETLTGIGEIFESKSDTTAKNLTVILEPALLVVVAMGVFAVAAAVIMPIYSLVGGLNNNFDNTNQPAAVTAPADSANSNK
jgi:type II secretory pathway component PulF